MQKLITERLTRTTSTALTETDRKTLIIKRDRQLLVMLPAYALILGICIFVWTGGSGSMDLDDKSSRVNFSNQDTEFFRMAVPYLCGIILLVATFYGVKIYIQNIHPLKKDLANNNKSLLYFIPERSTAAPLSRYYISTPLYKLQQLEISREVYDSIADNGEFCLEIATSSMSILGLSKEGKQIDYS